MRYVVARVNEDLLDSEIEKQIDVLQPIEQVAKAWKEVITETIKNCLRNVALLRKRVKLNKISTMRYSMHFSKNSQIWIVKEYMPRNTLILMSKHVVQYQQSAQIQQIGDLFQYKNAWLNIPAKNLERMIQKWFHLMTHRRRGFI